MQLEGNLVQWQRWNIRLSFNYREGLVLHDVGYQDGGRLRPIIHRMSLVSPGWGGGGGLGRTQLGWSHSLSWRCRPVAGSSAGVVFLVAHFACWGRHPLRRQQTAEGSIDKPSFSAAACLSAG